MTEAKRFTISGRVQGVFFRASTQEKAVALGLSGWVRNLSDGRVQVLACGEAPLLQELEQWLWQGPEKSEVDIVESVPAALEDVADYSDFAVLR